MKPLPARAPDGECAGQVQFNPFACPGESRVPASPRNILVFQLARFGDLVQTWPLLSRLRQAYPGARLTLLADQHLLPLQAMGPRMDEVLGFDFQAITSQVAHHWPEGYQAVEGFLRDLQARKFDLVFNLNFSRLSLLLTHLLGAPARGYLPVAGGREFFREPWLAWICSLVHARRFNRFHLTDVFRHLAPEPATALTGPGPPALRREAPVIALQLATRHERRTWPLTHFTRLAQYLADRLEARVLLLGTAAEQVLGEQLRAALPPALKERVINLQGKTGLTALAEQLKETHLVVSGDTGTLHLATAMGVPTLALFLGPALCHETGPYGCGHYVLQAEPLCHPCLEAASPCPEEGPICLQMLPPGAVARLISGLLETGNAPLDLDLPAGSRLYRSELDDFGVHYRYLGEEPPRFLDLVGAAYRRAGAWLADQVSDMVLKGEGRRLPGAGKHDLPAAAPAAPQTFLPTPAGNRKNLTAADLAALEWLVGTLQERPQPRLELPDATTALWPLMAFRTDMAEQGKLQLFYQVKHVFATALERWLAQMR